MLTSLKSGNIVGLNVRMVNIWHLFNTTNSWFVLLNKLKFGTHCKGDLENLDFVFLGII